MRAEAYLEARLIERVVDVFTKYTASEAAAGVGVEEGASERPVAQGAGVDVGGAAAGGGGEEKVDEQTKLILAPTVVVIIEGLLALQQQRLVRILPRIYGLLCALIESPDVRVRSALAHLFLQRIGPTLGMAASSTSSGGRSP